MKHAMHRVMNRGMNEHSAFGQPRATIVALHCGNVRAAKEV
jgi:hypothetical protein